MTKTKTYTLTIQTYPVEGTIIIHGEVKHHHLFPKWDSYGTLIKAVHAKCMSSASNKILDNMVTMERGVGGDSKCSIAC